MHSDLFFFPYGKTMTRIEYSASRNLQIILITSFFEVAIVITNRHLNGTKSF